MAANATTILSNNAKYQTLSRKQRLAITAYALSVIADGDRLSTYATNPQTLLKDAAIACKGLGRNQNLMESAVAGLMVSIASGNAFNVAGTSSLSGVSMNTLISKSAVLAGATEEDLIKCILYLVAYDIAL